MVRSNAVKYSVAPGKGRPVLNTILIPASLAFSNNNLVINNLDKNISDISNSFVYTSGLSDKFPSGILIGRISSLENDVYNVSKTATVDLASDINNLRFVAVLKRGITK